eukprot:6235899-Prymnesium_polylepis.1
MLLPLCPVRRTAVRSLRIRGGTEGKALEGRPRAKHVTNTEKKHKRDVTRYHTLAHARAAVVAVHAVLRIVDCA